MSDLVAVVGGLIQWEVSASNVAEGVFDIIAMR